MKYNGKTIETRTTFGGFGFTVVELDVSVPSRFGEQRPYLTEAAAIKAAKGIIDRAAPLADGGI